MACPSCKDERIVLGEGDQQYVLYYSTTATGENSMPIFGIRGCPFCRCKLYSEKGNPIVNRKPVISKEENMARLLQENDAMWVKHISENLQQLWSAVNKIPALGNRIKNLEKAISEETE